jgi:hypothetical protein
MGNLGALTFQPVNRVTVLRPNELSPLPDKDFLVIATLAHLRCRVRSAGAQPVSGRRRQPAGSASHLLENIWHLLATRPVMPVEEPPQH